MNKFFFVGLTLFYNVSCKAQPQRFSLGLNVFIERGSKINLEEGNIDFIFYNNSEDTILLPTIFFYDRDYVSLLFKQEELNPLCGAITNGYPSGEKITLSCENLNLIEIQPYKFKVYRYNLNSCGLDIKPNQIYQFQIKLNIQIKHFYVNCKNVWTGELFSNIGTLELEAQK